jgi:hypothetical protein
LDILWYAAPELRGKCIKVKLSGIKPTHYDFQGFKYGDYKDRCGIFVDTDEDKCARIRFSMEDIISVPMQYVLPVAPTIAGQHVVVVKGIIMGLEYTVVKLKSLHCGLKLQGKRGSKIEEYIFAGHLCVVF